MVARGGAEPLAKPTRSCRLCPPQGARCIEPAPTHAIQHHIALAGGRRIRCARCGNWWVGRHRWPHDWAVFEQIPQRLADGSLYHHQLGYNFAWSPAAAWIIAICVLPLGFHVWFILHAVLLAMLRDGRLIALAVCSILLWIDAGLGNTVGFFFVAGVFALRGNRPGELAFLALFVVIPRPVALPLAAWLLWRQPRTRLPFVAMASAVALSALASGYANDWLNALGPMTASHAEGDANSGPTRLLGLWWMGIGVPLAIWLTARRHVGLAGLAITPYLFPQYLLLALWDVVDHRRRVVEDRVVEVGGAAAPLAGPVLAAPAPAMYTAAHSAEPASSPKMS